MLIFILVLGFLNGIEKTHGEACDISGDEISGICTEEETNSFDLHRLHEQILKDEARYLNEPDIDDLTVLSSTKIFGMNIMLIESKSKQLPTDLKKHDFSLWEQLYKMEDKMNINLERLARNAKSFTVLKIVLITLQTGFLLFEGFTFRVYFLIMLKIVTYPFL